MVRVIATALVRNQGERVLAFVVHRHDSGGNAMSVMRKQDIRTDRYALRSVEDIPGGNITGRRVVNGHVALTAAGRIPSEVQSRVWARAGDGMVVDENQAIPPVDVIRGTNPDSAIPIRPPENVTEQAEGLIEVLHGTWVSNCVRRVVVVGWAKGYRPNGCGPCRCRRQAKHNRRGARKTRKLERNR